MRFRQGQGGIHQRQVAGCRGGRVVGLHLAEEAEISLLAWRQRQRRILDRQQRMFMLQALARQALSDALRQLARAQRQAVHLQSVGGECAAPPQRTDKRPGMAPGDRQVLARRQHNAMARVMQRRQVDVVADVVLVEPNRAVRRQADILHMHQVDGLRDRRSVLHADVPEPRRLAGGEAQLQPQRQALPLAAGLVHGVLKRRRGAACEWLEQSEWPEWPEQGNSLDAARAMPAQPQVGRPTLDLVAKEQVEHHAVAVHAAD